MRNTDAQFRNNMLISHKCPAPGSKPPIPWSRKQKKEQPAFLLLGTRVAIEIGCQAVLFGIGSINTEEKEYTEPFGHPPIEDFPEWEPVHIILLGNNVMGVENAGGDIEKVTGPALYHCGLPAALVYGRRHHDSYGRHYG